MFLNVDQLEKQLDKEEFQEIGSMAAFTVLETSFRTFIKSRIYLDDEYVIMTGNYFLKYTQLEISEFRDTLIQHMESIKKSIDERAQDKQEYDSRVNERQIQIIEEKVDTSNALDASWLTQKAVGQNQESKIQAADHGIMHMPIMQISDQYIMKSQWLRTTRAKTIEHITSLIAQKMLSSKHNFRKKGKPVLQPHRNQSVVRQLISFKSKRPRISKPRFASQVDVNNDLPKPVTTHYLPKGKESGCAKPHHMVAPGSSSSELRIHDHNSEPSSSKLVLKVSPPADKTATSQQELELLFSPMYEEYFNAGNHGVSKSFALSL
nr:hypothetical protein [Tanacetum cinerariifolium]